MRFTTRFVFRKNGSCDGTLHELRKTTQAI
ncbi:hypothetical protein J2Y45_003458 [Dyadobacter sp. BE34]|uniref:Transposase n=1 Tax=Dyadobacter fermentans TaxID=94254 RepID=A0ABU1QYR1_9BACT|nr:hypothetical protein [Dyadobacter fermentans]MDR7044007.1 hypothetical protein [Dyadobacter sp. BE242]MDR7198318.1 hypothetical protein [Dyadobacter sp. BE34]